MYLFESSATTLMEKHLKHEVHRDNLCTHESSLHTKSVEIQSSAVK